MRRPSLARQTLLKSPHIRKKAVWRARLEETTGAIIESISSYYKAINVTMHDTQLSHIYLRSNVGEDHQMCLGAARIVSDEIHRHN